jgi:hypothetical protein
VQVLPFELGRTRHVELARLEGPYAGCDDYRAGIEHRCRARDNTEATVGLALDLRDLLSQMHSRIERPDLLQQALCQLPTAAYRHGGNVVDRLVRIQLDALAAGRLE